MLGKAARNTIEQHYSVKENTANFLGLFDEKYLINKEKTQLV
jgi:hypothetical protein